MRDTGKVVYSIQTNHARCRSTMSEPYVLGANIEVIDLRQRENPGCNPPAQGHLASLPHRRIPPMAGPPFKRKGGGPPGRKSGGGYRPPQQPVRRDDDDEESKEGAIELEGTVSAVLAGTMFRVKLRNGHQVLAHISGKMRKRFIRLVVGDEVKIEMSPYDPDKARIVYRL